MGSALLFAGVLASAGAIAAARPPETVVPALPSPIPVEVTVVPPEVTPDPTFSMVPPDPRPGELRVGAVPSSTEPPLTGLAASGEPSSSTSQAPATIASSWSAGPTPLPAAPPASEPSSLRLAREAQERFGIIIVLDGQDWGADEASQADNIGAVISAIEQLPLTVTSSVLSHPHGPLTFVSNRHGRTLGGWQPYGDMPIGFYTNSDQGPGGYRAANQVVLIPGFSPMAVAHEVLHAYQFRAFGPDEYALALLGDEMRSFMAASGWTQVGSDEEVKAAMHDPWEAINTLFVYEGRPLTYATGTGSTATITVTNPIEAFAIAGSIYYTWPVLPDWPEYWGWFRANLG